MRLLPREETNMRKSLVALCCALAALTSCIATAPVSFAWRSNASQQYATTEAKNDSKVHDPAVNADKTTEAMAAVNTSSGTATTNDNSGASE